MAKLPPPPVVGRGAASSDADAEAAARAAAEAELPAAVVELPDAWLLEAEAEPAPTPSPTPTPVIAEASPNVITQPDIPAAPVTPTERLIPEPRVVAPVAAAPVAATTPPPPTAGTQGPRVVTTRVDPPSPPPTSAGSRTTMFAVAGVLGTALVAVLIARCNADTATQTTAREPIAEARVDGGRLAPPDDSTARTRERRGGNGSPNDGGSPANGAAAANGAAPANADTAAANDAAPTEPAKAEAAPAAPADDDEPTLEPNAAAPGGIDDSATPASTTKSASRPSSRTDTASSSGSTSTEPALTPAENLEKARLAWKAGNAKDTYKYANKSRFKETTPEATELATLAACKMKLDDAAKSSFKQLDGDRKKRTRNACRDFGVRVGL